MAPGLVSNDNLTLDASHAGSPVTRWFTGALMFALLLAGPGTVPSPAREQADVPRSLEIHRAAGAITVDGRLDDPGWRGAARTGGFVEIQPGDSTPPPVETEVLVAYDDANLYVGFVCHDPDPAGIRATWAERDDIFNDDIVGLLLDTFDGQQWAYELVVNPRGIPGDGLWNSGAGEDMGFDLVFASAAQITDDGWTAELAIPFSSLRFPPAARQRWRVDFFRARPRDVRSQMSWVPVDRDESCWPCQWGVLTGLEGIAPGRGLELLPAWTGSLAGARGADGVFRDGDPHGEPSLGAKLTLGSSATAEVAWNPDFSQVESDVPQIDVNTTFALWYPERRPFFQEGSDLWRSRFNVVYTRSVNDPLLAAKATIRHGDDSAALLLARDRHSPLIVPLQEASGFVAAGESDVAAVRVRRALGDDSFVGLVATGRWFDGGGHGLLAGVDGTWRLGASDQVSWQWLGTRTEEPRLASGLSGLFDGDRHTVALDGETFSGRAGYLGYSHSDRCWDVSASYLEQSPTFRADVGFEPANDRREAHLFLGWTDQRDQGTVTRWGPRFTLGKKWSWDGTPKDRWLWSALSAQFGVAQGWAQLWHMRSHERFQGVEFPHIFATGLSAGCRPSDRWSLHVNVGAGHRIARGELVMGRERSLSAAVSYKPWQRLVIDGEVRHVRSDAVADGRRLYRATVARTRWSLQASRELALRLVVQYDDDDRVWEVDPLLTYRVNPFSIFYVGSTRRYLEYDADAPLPGWHLGERQYFVKLQYLWRK